MFPAVIESVIGRVPTNRSAVIRDYQRREVAGESFPGLVKEDGATVEGLLYLNISEAEWDQLTIFEGDFYELEDVTVVSGGKDIRARVYLVPSSRKSLLSDKVWNPDRWAAAK